MNKSKDEANLAELFLNGSCSSDDFPLPMPRFGKVSVLAQQARSLSALGAYAGKDNESVSWIDEDDLGIRVFVVEEQGSKEAEIVAYVEGVRPELLAKVVSVALMAEKGDGLQRLSITLDKPSETKRGCSGKGSFGTAADLRKKLGDKVWLDVFLLE